MKYKTPVFIYNRAQGNIFNGVPADQWMVRLRPASGVDGDYQFFDDGPYPSKEAAEASLEKRKLDGEFNEQAA